MRQMTKRKILEVGAVNSADRKYMSIHRSTVIERRNCPRIWRAASTPICFTRIAFHTLDCESERCNYTEVSGNLSIMSTYF